jgi:thiamine biosynthesis protein ThiI
VNENIIVVRYGELALKKRETRKQFERTLKKNIRYAFASRKIDCIIENIWGRFYIYTSDLLNGIDILQRIFGITSVSPALTSSSDLKELSNKCISYLEGKIRTTDSFALRVVRTGQHDYTSQDAARIVGDYVRNYFSCSVNLKKPDIEVYIEIRDACSYIYLEKWRGPGGMPIGTQGRICSVVACDDDMLAAWYLMKRGCSLVFIAMNSSIKSDLSQFLSLWYVKSPIYSLESEEKFIERLGQIALLHHCHAVCMGSSFSKEKKEKLQLLNRIVDIRDSVSLPVLTPLIAMEKREIEQMNRTLGLKL